MHSLETLLHDIPKTPTLVKLNRQREFEPKYCHFELWLTIQYYIEFDTDKCPESVLNYFNVFIQVESGL